jgi:hypothetical protein
VCPNPTRRLTRTIVPSSSSHNADDRQGWTLVVDELELPVFELETVDVLVHAARRGPFELPRHHELRAVGPSVEEPGDEIRHA